MARSLMLGVTAPRASDRDGLSRALSRPALLLASSAAVMALTAGLYAAHALAYLDNGDGYYLYAARRIAQGAVLYRTVMGTQPPVVFALGAAAARLGLPLSGTWALSLAMRAAMALLVLRIGLRMFHDTTVAALGTLIFTLLPIGLAWDRSFDVNPPLTLLALLALWPLLRFTPRSAAVAGALGALALFTKDLYAPLLATTLSYLALRRRNLLLPYLAGLGVALAALAGTLTAYAGPHALHEAFLGQQGSPFDGVWLTAALIYVGVMEGGIVMVAVAGAWLAWKSTPEEQSDARTYAPWWLAGSSAVLLATVKEGTAGPVYQLAEPAVALLAAYAAVWAARRLAMSGASRAMRGAGALPGLALLAVLGLSIATTATGDLAVLRAGNEPQVSRVLALVRAHAAPGATILAPPYFALRTGTYLPGDAADTYMIAQQVRAGAAWAQAWMRRVDGALARRRIPIVLTDLRLAAIAPLMAALRANYRALPFEDGLPPALHVVAWLPDARPA